MAQKYVSHALNRKTKNCCVFTGLRHLPIVYKLENTIFRKMELFRCFERADLNQWTVHVEVEVTLRPTVSRQVSLDVRPPSGTRDQFFLLLHIFFRHLRVQSMSY
jgi:hypothetical protein